MTDEQIEEAREHGREMWEWDQRQGMEDRAIAHEDSREISELGILAEFTVADFLGFEGRTEMILGGDPGYDFVDENGIRIDAKLRRKKGGDLMIPYSLDNFQADIAVLAWPSKREDEFIIVGWSTRVHAAQVGKMEQVRIPTYVVPWKKLYDMRQIRSILCA